MDECISRDDVRRMILEYRADNPKKQTVWAMVISDMLRDLKEIPAEDVHPVKHGKWEYEKQGYDVYVECCECGLNLDMSNYIENEWREIMKYCPCCGAKMDKE